MADVKIGCTLFSFSNKFIRGEMNLEACVQAAADIGCDGYEIVATQMLPHYPYLTDEDVGMFQRLTQTYGIAPRCYAANMDRGLLPERDLTEDEMVAFAIRDIQNAHRFGCKVMREQFLISPQAMVRLAPMAEAYDVKIGIEIHNPETPTSPAIRAYRDAFARCGSKYLGFIPDFGCFATKPNKPQRDQAIASGAPLELLEMAKQLRMENVAQPEAMVQLAAAGANEAVMGCLAGMYGFVQFTKEPDWEGLKSIIPYSFEFHGKCHYVSEDLQEASIPYEHIVKLIAASDFSGYIMAEFENAGNYDEVLMTKRCVDMIRKYVRQN